MEGTWVLEKAMQVNDKLLSIFAIFVQTLTKTVENDVNIACFNNIH